jgi:hypothetical protein
LRLNQKATFAKGGGFLQTVLGVGIAILVDEKPEQE